MNAPYLSEPCRRARAGRSRFASPERAGDPTQVDDATGWKEADDLARRTVRRPRILIVEDNSMHSLLVGELLRDAYYEVEVAANGQEALERLATSPAPNLILLDLFMPHMDGWAFMRHREQSPTLASIPVVVITGAGNDALSRAPAAAAYLTKPFEIDHLLQTIARCMSR
jgi:CheY-like chemotaxis protein